LRRSQRKRTLPMSKTTIKGRAYGEISVYAERAPRPRRSQAAAGQALTLA
jgi:hypothetical protein